jgi:osmotically-inducible protein OsmY
MTRRRSRSDTRRAPRRARATVRTAARDDPPVLGTLGSAAERMLNERERGARGSHGFDGPSRWRADRYESSEAGRNGAGLTDERVRERVCARLAGLAILDARAVQVSVEDGQVVLTGSVFSEAVGRVAAAAAAASPGVVEVRNALRVVPRTSRGDDREILGTLG